MTPIIEWANLYHPYTYDSIQMSGQKELKFSSHIAQYHNEGKVKNDKYLHKFVFINNTKGKPYFIVL